MKFRLTFEAFDEAWHENVRERIKRIDAEYRARGEEPPGHDMYYNAQFDDIPFIEWEEMFDELKGLDDFVEFEI